MYVFSSGSDGKEFACNAGDLGSITGSERSPGEGNGYALQYSGLENSMDCIVHGDRRIRKWRITDDFLTLQFRNEQSHFHSYFIFIGQN